MSAQIRGDTVVPSGEAIRRQLNRVVASDCFSRSERMRRFLRHVVEEELAGRNDGIKEYSIALNVYDKPPDFDPRIDPIVRIEARRLREKLNAFYSEEGLLDELVISLPKKTYVPQYTYRRATPSAVRRIDFEDQSLYLKARYFWNKRTIQDVRNAMDCLNRVLSHRPDFALARAGMAECYATLAWLESLSPETAWPTAKTAANIALILDSSLAEAHNALACEKALYTFDWAGAEACFQNAFAINSSYSTAHHWFGFFCLTPQGRFEEAILQLELALELEPASAAVYCHMGRIEYFRRDYDAAIRQLHSAIRFDPTFYLAHWALGFVYVQLSDIGRAETAFVAAFQLSKSPLTVAGLAYVFGLSGQRDRVEEALSILGRLTANSSYLSPINTALVKIASGEHETAIAHLEAAVQNRAPRAVHAKVDPAFDPVKTDVRFITLLKLMNL